MREADAAIREAFRAAGFSAEGAAAAPPIPGSVLERIAAEAGAPLAAVERHAIAEGFIPRRYARNLPAISREGQAKLLSSKVLVAGLGGLGGYLVEQLARIGVGAIVAADPDAFDEQNQNRQLLCLGENLGKCKADGAALRVPQINPAVRWRGYAQPIETLPAEVFAGIDAAFDGLDNVASRLHLEQRCHAAAVPLIHGAVGGWCGQVGVSWPGSRLLERLYGDARGGIEQTEGTPPFAPGLVASFMIALGVKVLLGLTPPDAGRLWVIDLLSESFETISFERE